MKIMAIDLGDVRTGVSFSDLSGFIAGRSFTLKHNGATQLLSMLESEIATEKPSKIVLGLPLNMDGSEGERAQKSRRFAQKLEQAFELPVVLWDERGTSITANRILSDAGKKRAKQKARVDSVAAAIILQSYLDSGK